MIARKKTYFSQLGQLAPLSALVGKKTEFYVIFRPSCLARKKTENYVIQLGWKKTLSYISLFFRLANATVTW